MTRDEVLVALKAGKLSVEDAGKALTALEPVVARAPFVMKVSEKGCITFRGVPGTHHSFGLSLYAEGVEYLLAKATEIKAFIAKNNGALSRKDRSAA
jgi:hypothetical protein